MGDQQDGGAGFTPQPQQFVAHQEAGLLVERAERLVEQDDARPLNQGPRKADTLAHAAGQLHRIGGGKFGQAHQAKRMIDPRGDLRFVQSRLAQPERDVVGDGEPGKARVLLEHDADAVRHLAGDRVAFERRGAFGWTVQPGDDLEQRRFPAARRADDGEKFPAHQVEIDRPERPDLGLLRRGRKDARDAAQRDVDAHGYWVLRLRSSGRKLSSMILLQSGSVFSAPTIFCARIISFMAFRLISPALQ